MSTIKTSIIIPVFNKWDLTRNCLKSLANGVDKDSTEVLVIDNASTDATPEASVFLGKNLFGENFVYIRNEQNRNFAGASNQGAEKARGEFLVFLNNDTKPEGDWLTLLQEDFERYPQLAATGPMLVYPHESPFGRQIQHLGVLVSPYIKFGHLYKGLPEDSSLSKKRRFFQAITAACMMMNKSLFMETGKFDEAYINGFEDVDLCGRLTAKGLRFTINPDSKVIHYESQTPGRGKDDEKNFSHLRDTSIKYFISDWGQLLHNDGMAIHINKWLQMQIRLDPHIESVLEKNLHKIKKEELKDLLLEFPYWEKGWKKYLNLLDNQSEYLNVYKIFFQLFKTVPNAIKACRLGEAARDKLLNLMGRSVLASSILTPQQMFKNAEFCMKWCENSGSPVLASQYASWLKNYDAFCVETYPLYSKHFSL